MNQKRSKPSKTTAKQIENKPAAEPLTESKKNTKKPSVTKSGNAKITKEAAALPATKPQSTAKKAKTVKEKVIRDSFSFPENDYLKISELKQTCLAAGIHVKKSELLRAGLQLLTQLNIADLKQAVEQVEKIKTGRPNS